MDSYSPLFVTLVTQKGLSIAVSALSALAIDLSPQCLAPTRSTVPEYYPMRLNLPVLKEDGDFGNGA
jgi:hypothetical protein